MSCYLLENIKASKALRDRGLPQNTLKHGWRINKIMAFTGCWAYTIITRFQFKTTLYRCMDKFGKTTCPSMVQPPWF